VPSLVLDGDETFGKLYLGGFKAAINKDFLANENVRSVVNTVGDGLFTLFGRKFQVGVCMCGTNTFILLYRN